MGQWMIMYSKYAHEKLIRQAVPDVTDDEIDQVVFHYEKYNPLYSQRLTDVAKRNTRNFSKHHTNFNKIYIESAKKIINAENPTDEIILAFKDYDINTVLKVCTRRHVDLTHQLRQISKELWKKPKGKVLCSMKDIRREVNDMEDKKAKWKYREDNAHRLWTVKKLKAELDKKGIKYKKTARKAELINIYEQSLK